MHRRRIASLLLPLALASAGCGSGGSSPSTTSTSSGGGNFRERPGQQPTSLHISRSDCKALAATVERQTTAHLRLHSDPTPPNSQCRLQGPGVHISISLDTAYDARRRYENRMTEQVQFNAPYPARDPHRVANVGDPAPGEHFASWIPAYSTLYAVRGNRWLTLAYSVAGKTRPQRLIAAAPLARQAFRLTTRQAGSPPSASPARR
jgi:hypothetical protein